jgi:hypothetical protein
VARFNDRIDLQRVDTSLAKPFESHAQNLAKFANELGQITQQYAQAGETWKKFADKKQADYAAKDAEADIAAGKSQTYKGGSSTYQTVYDKKMRDSYVSSLAQDMQKDLQRIEAEASGDTAKFNSMYSAAVDGYRKEVEPQAFQEVFPVFDKLAHSTRLKVNATEIDDNQKKANDIFNQGIYSAMNLSQGAVQSGTAEDIALASNVFMEAVNKSTHLTPDQKTKIISTNMRAMTNESVWRDIDEVVHEGGVDAGLTKLYKMSEETPPDYTPEEWRETLSRKLSELTKIKKGDKTQQAASKKLINYLVSNANDAIDTGAILPQHEVAKLQSMAADHPDDLVLQLQVKQLNRAVSIAHLSLPELEQLQLLGSYNDTIGGTIDANTINKVAEAKKAGYKKDPMGFAVIQGVADNVPLTDAESYKKRGFEALKVQDHTGSASIPSPLTKSEITRKVVEIESSDSLGKVDLINQLSQFGQASQSAYEAIAGKGSMTAKVFAMTASIGDTNIMDAIFKGQDIQKAGGYKNPKDDDIRSTFESYVGNTYRTENKGIVLQAAKDHYASIAPNDGNFHNDLFKQSLEAVTGGIGYRNKFNYELPRGIDEDDFEDYLYDFNEQTIEHFGGVNVSFDDAKELINKGRVKSVGNNKYNIIDSRGMMLMNKKGEPFTFDYNALTPRAIKKTAPELDIGTPYSRGF